MTDEKEGLQAGTKATVDRQKKNNNKRQHTNLDEKNDITAEVSPQQTKVALPGTLGGTAKRSRICRSLLSHVLAGFKREAPY